jgi:hypothetical protein
MARIKYTALVESIRGSIGGTTFQANAYGFTIKAKPNMLNPNTQRQNNAKAIFSTVAQRWRNLSNANRAAWDAYANAFPIPSRKNPDSYLSGYAAFVRWHGLMATGTGFTLDNPSGPQGTVFSGLPTVSLSAGDLRVIPDIAFTEGPWYTFAFMTRPLSPTQTFIKSWLRFVAAVDESLAPDFSVTLGYERAFGFLPADGDLVGIQLAYINTTNGQVLWYPADIRTVQ